MEIPEKLIHYIWRFRSFYQFDLKSQCGLEVEILDPGILNIDAGPDFLCAKIRLDGALFVGNVEIHRQGKDWNAHLHHQDKAYETVILHVIWTDYVPIHYENGKEIPTLVIGALANPGMINQYKQLQESFERIPCAAFLPKVPPPVRSQTTDRMAGVRLAYRYQEITVAAEQIGWNWERLMFIWICRSFGMRANKIPFERFGKSFPFALLKKYSSNVKRIEALLFGQAGFLSEKPQDTYQSGLQAEYKYQVDLHGLSAQSSLEWKFMRMRPQNFPTMRIAQLAAMINAVPDWTSLILSQPSPDGIISVLTKVGVSDYWNTHFRFGSLNKFHAAGLSEEFCSHILVNAFVPVLYSYGVYTGQAALASKAMEWLHVLPAEKNNVTKIYINAGFDVKNAVDSQGILHLRRFGCEQKRCLDCPIGIHILSRT